jgi:hypothetical protein
MHTQLIPWLSDNVFDYRKHGEKSYKKEKK